MTIARPHIEATLLTVIAGIADAVGYITMGGVFAANMTGNTVLAGIAAAESRYADAARHLMPLVAFFAGAMLARLMLRLWDRRSLPILVEIVLVAGLGFLPIGVEAQVMVLALAMGLQAAAITHFAGAAVSTVVVTSTLARTAEAAVDRLWPGTGKSLPTVNMPSLLALSWTGYLVGAAAGAFLLKTIAWPLLVPAALLVLVILV
ncbi:YoaK family protein [Reyranella sp.]|uniref:YoaK family protein n=1 Tax=Reyranella sp. TaxID=1929291 RepID=UPI003BACCF87